MNCTFTFASHGISQLLGGRFHVWPTFWHYIKCLGWPLRLPSLLCLEWHCNPCLLQFLLYCLPPHGIEPSMQIVVWLFGSTFGFHVITLIHNQMCPVVNNIIFSMNQSWTCREWCCPGVSSMVCAMKWHCNWPKWHFIVCVTHGNPQGFACHRHWTLFLCMNFGQGVH